VRRRQLIALLAGAPIAWPVRASAQQAMPVIGFLHPASPDADADRLRSFRDGLREAGYVEGEMSPSFTASRRVSSIACRGWRRS